MWRYNFFCFLPHSVYADKISEGEKKMLFYYLELLENVYNVNDKVAVKNMIPDRNDIFQIDHSQNWI